MLMALKLSLVLLVLVLSYVATWDLLLLDYLNSVDLNIHYSISADTQNLISRDNIGVATCHNIGVLMLHGTET